MADDPGGRDPDVTVDELVVGGSGRRVVVDAGALDAGAVAWRGRVVQGEQPPGAGVDGAAQVAEQQSGTGGDLAAAERTEDVVGAAEVVADAGGAEPGGGGAAAVGQEFTDEQRLDQFGVAAVEEAGHAVEEALDGIRGGCRRIMMALPVGVTGRRLSQHPVLTGRLVSDQATSNVRLKLRS